MIEEPIEEPINADPTYAPLIEAERQAAEDAAQDQKGRGVLRFYELAKKQEWQVRDLAWGEIPPIPEGIAALMGREVSVAGKLLE